MGPPRRGRGVGGRGWDSADPSLPRLGWAKGLARGLGNVHAAGVTHNSVACRNTLLSSKGMGGGGNKAFGQALLCDFGVSSLFLRTGLEAVSALDSDGVGGARAGAGGGGMVRELWPVKQMPLEALRPPHTLSTASDVFMFGTTLYELYMGKAPFAGITDQEAIALVLEGKPLEIPPLLKHQVGQAGVSLFQDCLSAQVEGRPSMEQVVSRLDHCLAPPPPPTPTLTPSPPCTTRSEDQLNGTLSGGHRSKAIERPSCLLTT
ncbi:unnamed protein product [Discosporangium mesarthrocarpum]